MDRCLLLCISCSLHSLTVGGWNCRFSRISMGARVWVQVMLWEGRRWSLSRSLEGLYCGGKSNSLQWMNRIYIDACLI